MATLLFFLSWSSVILGCFLFVLLAIIGVVAVIINADRQLTINVFKGPLFLIFFGAVLYFLAAHLPQ